MILPCSDKSKIMYVIIEREEGRTSDSRCFGSRTPCYESYHIRWHCKDLKNLFLERILMDSQGFSEIRLVFDIYVESSLKERTRERRISGKATRYIVRDSTSIVGVNLKDLYRIYRQSTTSLFILLNTQSLHLRTWK